MDKFMQPHVCNFLIISKHILRYKDTKKRLTSLFHRLSIAYILVAYALKSGGF